MARAISIAIKTGGGADPNTNYKLRIAIDSAKTAGVPKDNIDRLLNKSVSDVEDITEVTYEGFGPFGIAVIVEAATNNKNRTAQEIKNIFSKSGGNLAGPGSVAFNFEPKGLIVVTKKDESENQMMSFLDSGAEDFEEVEGSYYLYVSYGKLSAVRDKLVSSGNQLESSELTQKPKNLMKISDKEKVRKVISFIDSLNEHEDVQKVFSNADLDSEILENLDL
jgi:YebC/PmpR family DNA-binding regulatory protein